MTNPTPDGSDLYADSPARSWPPPPPAASSHPRQGPSAGGIPGPPHAFVGTTPRDPHDPATYLTNARWRRRHSLWLLAPVLGIGYFSFVGLLYCALRVRDQRFTTAAVLATALSLAALIGVSVFPDDSLGANIAAGSTAVLWLSTIVYSVVVNRDYLRWHAAVDARGGWMEEI